MSDIGCERFAELSAELALGVLDGRERAAAMVHLERCAACRRELAALGEVADGLVGLAPPAEPPAGFETRVLAALTPAAARPARHAGFIRRASVAAAIAVAVGAGGWALGRATGPAARPGPTITAALVTGQRPVGRLVAYTGAHPWVSMTVETPTTGPVRLRCELRERDGGTVVVGSFTVDGGYGYWAAPVPSGGHAVVGARILDGGGDVVAAASLPAGLRSS